MSLTYKELRVMIGQLNKVAGFIQFTEKGETPHALAYIMGVINSLNDEVDRQIEEIVKAHENCKGE